ncbi:MAG TPA: Ig-like domain-containing protein, partial [Kofleriaceae bacterium]|nr:Ig-like domain-containing protein [Kofleriaceae bacterium]
MPDRSSSTRTLAPAVLAFALLGASACGNRGGGTSAPAGSGSAPPERAVVQAKDAPPGLELRVSSGKAGPPAVDHARLAPARTLPDAESGALLARMKPIAAEPQDAQSFALRGRSQPPPRTGQTIQAGFPPPAPSSAPPPAGPAGELRVVRTMPEGAVPLAPELSVTFSQPMVAVTSQTDAAQVTPVKLMPQPPGSWRWIGTRTIVFHPDVRFPQATSYRVEIPAGTASATGGKLARPVSFAFETPPPTMVSHYPEGSPQRLDAPMFALFDQKIDPAAVLARITVKAAGQVRAVRLLDAAEIARDHALAAVVDGARRGEQDGRWLAFRATEPLPSDTQVDVVVGPGTPSAEGPGVSPHPQLFQFSTYAPLRIKRSQCGGGSACPPGMPFEIEFNNPIDAERFEDRQIAITPAIPGLKRIAAGQTVQLVGLTAARTRYSVVVSRGVVDEFGQALGKDAPLTWSVGDATPTLFGTEGVVVLDPAATRPTLDVFSTGYDRLAVQLHAVTPADFDAYRTAMRTRWNRDRAAPLPGRKVFDQRVATGGPANQLSETHVDLRPALGPGGLGHAIAVIEPSPWTEKGPPPRLIAWVQATRLGIDVHVDGEQLLAHVSQLDTGKAAAGVALQLAPYGIAGTTDDRGMATLALADGQRKGVHYLVARKGDDVAFVAGQAGFWSDSGDWFRHPAGKQLAWYVTDDRKLYKPGEEVSLKGWLRTIDQARNGDVGGLAGAVTGVTYKVMDAQGNQIAAGSAPVNPAGGFDTRFTLPKTPNLGQAEVVLEAQGSLGGNHAHPIEIEEFRRPEFEVSAQASQGPLLVGGGGDVAVSAKYFAGGPLAGAPVAWTVSAAQTSFAPPGRDDYVFGIWQPWWGPMELDEAGPIRYTPPRTWTLAATTDAIGAHTLHLDFVSVRPSVPMSVTATAQVTDVNRQVIAASAAMIVHPSSLYVGVKTRRPFVERGTPFEVELIGVDHDGKAAPGAKIGVEVVRRDWAFEHGKLAIKEVDPQSCAVIAGQAPSPCLFQTRDGGEYQLTATIVDAQGRPNQTRLAFWVSGGTRPPARDVAQERVQLIPDKKDYTPGNTAEILVQAPFYPAEGVVSWRRSGIVKAEKITLDGPTTVITVPIGDAMVPNLIVQVDLVGLAVRTDDAGVPDPKLPRRPAYAVGTIDLAIPPRRRTLSVDVAPAAARLSPGEKTSIAVAVRDAAGQPVAGAEAAVIVVDESILSLTGAQFDSPLGAFYPPRGPETRDAYSQAYVKLARPDVAELQRGAATASNGARALYAIAPGGAAPEPAPPAPAPAPAMEVQAQAMVRADKNA